MQDDGNLVYYDCNGVWIWTSKQNKLNPDYKLTLCDASKLIEPHNSISICPQTTSIPTTEDSIESIYIVIIVIIGLVIIGGATLLGFIFCTKFKHSQDALRYNLNANHEAH